MANKYQYPSRVLADPDEATSPTIQHAGCENKPFYPTHCHALTFRKVTSQPNKPHIAHIPLPRPLPPKKVLIKVHFASLNPVDTQLLNFPVMSYIPGEKGLGRDLAGTIVAVGDEVDSWKVEDEVIVFFCNGNYFSLSSEARPGALTDYLMVEGSEEAGLLIVRKPRNVNWEEAAGIPLVALTAFTVLEWLPPVVKNPVNVTSEVKRQVLIVGASGGVGIVTAQLAKILHNCHVTAICSSRNSAYVQNILQADKVIEYNKLPPEHPTLSSYLLSHKPPLSNFYNLIIDCIGDTEIVNIYRKLLHKQGAYVTIVGPKNGRLTLCGLGTLLAHPQQIVWYLKGALLGPRYGCVLLRPRKDWLLKAIDLVSEGKLRIELEKVVDSGKTQGWESEEEGWGEAFRILDGGRSRGKVVIKISEPGLDKLVDNGSGVGL